MSEENSAEIVNENSSTEEPQVNWEEKAKEWEKYKTDMFKYKDQTKSLSEQNQQLQQKITEFETKNLENSQNYKELWERERQRAEENEQRYSGVLRDFEEGKKMDAIRQEALKSGIKEEALMDLDILDKSIVAVEKTDRGNVNILGAKEFVEDLKKSRPFWFNDHSAPKVNSNPPGVPNMQDQKLSPKDVLKLQKENPEAYSQYVLKHSGRI